MEASLAICILAALLAMGTCLQCEFCTGAGNNCTGSMQTCAAGQDSCAFIRTDVTMVGVKGQSFLKSCLPSSECKVGPVSMNFGQVMTTRTSIVCCVGDACRTTTGGSQMQTVMKGCASESICANIKVGSGTFAGSSVDLTTAKCTVASGAVGVAPGLVEILLPALAGLLLLKLLS
ncbi:phospholipase A2 inhibitor subunit gamma B-like [Mauremys reevesii]|uniref:phospholipase A2 inhibitor subunit gamma B-like n=1 Tax=Mauremys reevesii TaxID=260615 RepID=UPI00193FC438|nr:phospholipase A2 inhibitor subunit gamma B-like [Mauremys reevesii]